jgi:hypothetical protein
MTEIVTCVRCGQWVHDPENGRVCAEGKAEDLEEEGREEIEFQLAYPMPPPPSKPRLSVAEPAATPLSCSIAGAQWVKTTTGNGC